MIKKDGIVLPYGANGALFLSATIDFYTCSDIDILHANIYPLWKLLINNFGPEKTGKLWWEYLLKYLLLSRGMMGSFPVVNATNKP